MKKAGVIPLILISLTICPFPVWAKHIRRVSKPVDSASIYFAQQPKFPDNGAPTGRRRGGTSRDGCPGLNMPVTALVPGEETFGTVQGATSSKSGSKSFLASTVAEYPTFLFYVPALPTNIGTGEFVLQNEAGDDVYRIPLLLPQQPGIISISLPQSLQYSLEINKKYHWYFKVFCDAQKRTSEYFFVDGWVQRIALTRELENQLNKAKPGKYMVYATNNLLYDALINLANLRRTNLHNAILAKDWADLLKSIGLPDLTHVPIVRHYNQLPTKT